MQNRRRRLTHPSVNCVENLIGEHVESSFEHEGGGYDGDHERGRAFEKDIVQRAAQCHFRILISALAEFSLAKKLPRTRSERKAVLRAILYDHGMAMSL